MTKKPPGGKARARLRFVKDLAAEAVAFGVAGDGLLSDVCKDPASRSIP